MKSVITKWFVGLGVLVLLASAATADVTIARVFSDNMVLQRNVAVPIWGWADPGQAVSVQFAGQSKTTNADRSGKWMLRLEPLKASAAPRELVVKSKGADIKPVATIRNVLVGDVWLCSGQSNMDWRLGQCDRPQDIAGADFPAIREFAPPYRPSAAPCSNVSRNVKWIVCSPETAGRFSAVSFYFAREIHRDQKGKVPLGLLRSAVGGTQIDFWLAPEGIFNQPLLHKMIDSGDGNRKSNRASKLYNGMIYPLAPYAIRGAIWYQGESGDMDIQTPDSYYLKMKALVEGWEHVWGMKKLPFYFVLISNYGKLLKTDTPILRSGGWDADIRLQQVCSMSLPDVGCASALDLGVSKVSWPGYHPKNKQDVGQRLALWALKNQYGRSDLVVSGPVLRGLSVKGDAVVCSFDHVGGGLMVGKKIWYQPTEEVKGGSLKRFVIAGRDGKWYPAIARIKDNKVLLSSPKVTKPHKVSYACWQNPEGCNLYNREGLPAAPFHVEDVSLRFSIAAKAGLGGVICPAGVASRLKRMTALYKITPSPGYHIRDVKVDGVSIGPVANYVFDPLQKNHTITAEFSRQPRRFTIAASARPGGSISPSGRLEFTQGQSAAFKITPDPDNLAYLTADGLAMGKRKDFTFSDIHSNHKIEARFKCIITPSADFGGSIIPGGRTVVDYGASQTFKISPISGFSIAGVKVDGVEKGRIGSYSFKNIKVGHRIEVKFSQNKAAASDAGGIPHPEQLIFACRASALPDKGPCKSWPALQPAGKSFASQTAIDIKTLNGKKFANIIREDAPCFLVRRYQKPVACRGAAIVAVARPIRDGARTGWSSIVDVFYNRLMLSIRGDSGLVHVCVNGKRQDSSRPIPDGKIVILSLVVQPDGKYKVFANGAEIMKGDSGVAMNSLVPGPQEFAKSITIARNAPDAWTAFSGQIGDLFLYKTALTDAERKRLETRIIHDLVAPK